MALLRVPVTSRDHMQGGADPLVTLVEYGDYQCPHCAAAQPIVKQIQNRIGDRLLLVFRHFPLVEVHPLAGPAAEAAEFAGSRERFWPMHEMIFANQHQLSIPLLIALASSLKLSVVDLRDALAYRLYASKVQADFIGGVRSGVNGTPTFFINGVRHDHPLGAAVLSDAIDQALAAVPA
jgi:protein-disulfide isomerase